MANFKTTITMALIATASSAYADGYPDYQAQQQAADAQFQQSTATQNAVNQARSMDAPPQPVYQQPAYQPLTTNTAYGTVYVGPGSGYTQP